MSSDLWQFLHLPLIFINVGSLEERCPVPGRMSPSLGLSAVALSIRLELWVFGKNIEEMKGPAHCLLAGGTVNPRSIPGEVYCRICPRPAHCALGCFSLLWLCAAPWTAAHQAPQSMGSPGKSTGAGCHALLQGIFPTQELNPRLLCLPLYKWILYC